MKRSGGSVREAVRAMTRHEFFAAGIAGKYAAPDRRLVGRGSDLIFRKAERPARAKKAGASVVHVHVPPSAPAGARERVRETERVVEKLRVIEREKVVEKERIVVRHVFVVRDADRIVREQRRLREQAVTAPTSGLTAAGEEPEGSTGRPNGGGRPESIGGPTGGDRRGGPLPGKGAGQARSAKAETPSGAGRSADGKRMPELEPRRGLPGMPERVADGPAADRGETEAVAESGDADVVVRPDSLAGDRPAVGEEASASGAARSGDGAPATGAVRERRARADDDGVGGGKASFAEAIRGRSSWPLIARRQGPGAAAGRSAGARPGSLLQAKGKASLKRAAFEGALIVHRRGSVRPAAQGAASPAVGERSRRFRAEAGAPSGAGSRERNAAGAGASSSAPGRPGTAGFDSAAEGADRRVRREDRGASSALPSAPTAPGEAAGRRLAELNSAEQAQTVEAGWSAGGPEHSLPDSSESGGPEARTFVPRKNPSVAGNSGAPMSGSLIAPMPGKSDASAPGSGPAVPGSRTEGEGNFQADERSEAVGDTTGHVPSRAENAFYPIEDEGDAGEEARAGSASSLSAGLPEAFASEAGMQRLDEPAEGIRQSAALPEEAEGGEWIGGPTRSVRGRFVRATGPRPNGSFPSVIWLLSSDRLKATPNLMISVPSPLRLIDRLTRRGKAIGLSAPGPERPGGASGSGMGEGGSGTARTALTARANERTPSGEAANGSRSNAAEPPGASGRLVRPDAGTGHSEPPALQMAKRPAGSPFAAETGAGQPQAAEAMQPNQTNSPQAAGAVQPNQTNVPQAAGAVQQNQANASQVAGAVQQNLTNAPQIAGAGRNGAAASQSAEPTSRHAEAASQTAASASHPAGTSRPNAANAAEGSASGGQNNTYKSQAATAGRQEGAASGKASAGALPSAGTDARTHQDARSYSRSQLDVAGASEVGSSAAKATGFATNPSTEKASESRDASGGAPSAGLHRQPRLTFAKWLNRRSQATIQRLGQPAAPHSIETNAGSEPGKSANAGIGRPMIRVTLSRAGAQASSGPLLAHRKIPGRNINGTAGRAASGRGGSVEVDGTPARASQAAPTPSPPTPTSGQTIPASRPGIAPPIGQGERTGGSAAPDRSVHSASALTDSTGTRLPRIESGPTSAARSVAGQNTLDPSPGTGHSADETPTGTGNAAASQTNGITVAAGIYPQAEVSPGAMPNRRSAEVRSKSQDEPMADRTDEWDSADEDSRTARGVYVLQRSPDERRYPLLARLLPGAAARRSGRTNPSATSSKSMESNAHGAGLSGPLADSSGRQTIRPTGAASPLTAISGAAIRPEPAIPARFGAAPRRETTISARSDSADSREVVQARFAPSTMRHRAGRPIRASTAPTTTLGSSLTRAGAIAGASRPLSAVPSMLSGAAQQQRQQAERGAALASPRTAAGGMTARSRDLPAEIAAAWERTAERAAAWGRPAEGASPAAAGSPLLPAGDALPLRLAARSLAAAGAGQAAAANRSRFPALAAAGPAAASALPSEAPAAARLAWLAPPTRAARERPSADPAPAELEMRRQERPAPVPAPPQEAVAAAPPVVDEEQLKAALSKMPELRPDKLAEQVYKALMKRMKFEQRLRGY